MRDDFLRGAAPVSRLFNSTIEACRCGPLVYVRTLKCASSFFYNNFTQNFHWEKIDFDRIDWTNHHVFSHIMDPIERRHKGVLEYILMTGAKDLLRNSAEFKNLIQHVPMLDDHSMSYHETYGHLCWMIDWIPTGLGFDTTVDLTERLLWKYNIRILGRWDATHARPASPELLELAGILRDLWNKGDSIPPATQRYLVRDMVLFERVMRSINAGAADWDHTSWMRQRQFMPLFDDKYFGEEIDQCNLHKTSA